MISAKVGDIEGRVGSDELSVEWQIQNIPSLVGEGIECFDSPRFQFGNDRWCLRLWPNMTNKSKNPAASECLTLRLRRCGGGPSESFQITVGIRESGAIRLEEKVEKEICGYEFFEWKEFCLKSDLMARSSRLLPDGKLAVTCDIKRVLPGAAKAVGELPSDVLVFYSYDDLQMATKNFCDLPLQAGGCKIGEGGFGTVYRAIIKGVAFAVKRLKDPVDEQFRTELKTLTKYKHENLLPLHGFSLGPPCCLVYEYMPNGSLEDRLSLKNQDKPLGWQTRLSISYGAALGIDHLHTSGDKPMVHRDIKSANILLNQHLVPKVGDFGLVRLGDSGGSTTLVVTGRFGGTYSYMPREALVGDVSVKWDTFSFGVVLLELLSGLPPYDRNREDRLLITHMENCKDIIPRLDPKGKWNKEAATELYRITQRCLAESKRSRPTISEILKDLRKLSVLR